MPLDAQQRLVEKKKPSRLSRFIEKMLARAIELLRLEDSRNDGDRTLRPASEFVAFIEDDEQREIARQNIIFGYYQKAREEISREDNITFQRTNITLIFQGFLATGVAILFQSMFICGVGDAGVVCSVNVPQWLLSHALIFGGVVSSYFAFHGIDAARRSVLWAKDQWVEFNRINGEFYPSVLPQLTKRANRHSYDPADGRIGAEKFMFDCDLKKDAGKRVFYRDQGWDFALAIPIVLMLLWMTIGLMNFCVGLAFFIH